MVCRTRIKYTAQQKADIRDRWQRGESLCSIGRSVESARHSCPSLVAREGQGLVDSTYSLFQSATRVLVIRNGRYLPATGRLVNNYLMIS